VLERVIGEETRLMLVYPERAFVPPAVRAFIEAVVAWSEKALDPKLRRRPPALEIPR
jgi:hypothetical protein